MTEHEHKAESWIFKGGDSTPIVMLAACPCGASRWSEWEDGKCLGWTEWESPPLMFAEISSAGETITRSAPPIWIDEAWERARAAPPPEQCAEVEREEVSIVCEDAKRLDGGFMEKLLARYAQAMLPPDDIPKGLRREERLAHIAGELLPESPYAVLAFEDERRGILRLQFLEHADPQTAERFRRIAASHLALTLAIEVGAARP